MDLETKTAAVNKSKKIHGLVGFSSIVGKLVRLNSKLKNHKLG